MQKLMVPAALALAMTLGGGAFAASTAAQIDSSLYGQASPFAAVAVHQADTHRETVVDRSRQRASTAPMPAQDWQAKGWDKPSGARTFYQRDPE